MAFVRPYKSTDTEAMIHIFRETAAPELRAEPDPNVLHIGSHLWVRPYIYMHPQWCHVVDDGQGTAVGYVVCAPNTADFATEFRDKYIKVIEDAGITRPDETVEETRRLAWVRNAAFHPEDMLHPDYPNLVRSYPAHLHIDILPSHQGQNLGPVLMETLFKQLKDAGVPGIHLGMAAANERAGRFYAKLGFKPFEEMSGNGRPGFWGGAIWLVREIH